MAYGHSKRQAALGLSASVLGLISVLGAPGTVWAQSASSLAASSQETASKTRESTADLAVEEIVVTATGTNISGVKPVGSEAVVLDREAILATGLTNVTDIVRTLPQVQNTGDFREGGNYYSWNTTQGSSINLRGIGQSATLILIDGRRVAPTGTSQAFTESNQVPLAALERIEVIADGASAVYGSDAVSGVVNYVMRKDYEGGEAQVRYSDKGGYNELNAGVTVGKSWTGVGQLGSGNILGSFEYGHRDALLRGDNPWMRQDLTRYGNLDGRLNGATATPGLVGNIVVANVDPDGFFGPAVAPTNPTIPNAGTNTYYGLPVGANTALTVANLLLNKPNLADSADYTDYIGKMKRKQASLSINQELTPTLKVFLQGIYGYRETYSRSLSTSSSISLPSTSPYYISGIPNVAPGAPLTVQYNFFKDVGYSNTSNVSRNVSVSTGLQADLPGGWKGDLSLTHSIDRSCGACNVGNYINTTAFQAEVNAGRINPLSSQPLSASQIATFTGSNYQKSRNVLDDLVLKANGALFDLPGGKVRAALGLEYSYASNWLTNGKNQGVDNLYRIDNTTQLRRMVYSGFGELYVPLVGKANAMPLVEELNLSAAVRYDAYSDAGNTTNPKVGLTWVVDDDLSLRGSWGTSFRAPGLPDRNPNIFSAVYVNGFVTNNSGDPNIVNGSFGIYTNQLTLIGSNADLKPETATNWSLGFDYKPHYLRGFKLSGTYYNIKYENRIKGPDTGLFFTNAANRKLYEKYITVIKNPATCVNGNPSTYDQALLPFINAVNLYGGPITNACSINVVADGRFTNMASTLQEGVDMQASYGFANKAGYWTVGASVTKILKNDEKIIAGAPSVERLDYYNDPVSLRGRGSLSWSRDGLSVNAFVNYSGSYTNDRPITINNVIQPQAKIDAYVTMDLGLSYTVPEDKGRGWSKGLRASVNILNITDENPPIVLTSGSAFNAQFSDPFGRNWTVQLIKPF